MNHQDKKRNVRSEEEDKKDNCRRWKEKNPSWGSSDLDYLSGIDTNLLLFR